MQPIDHYPVGDGAVGPITQAIQALHFEVAKGVHAAYRHCLIPICPAVPMGMENAALVPAK